MDQKVHCLLSYAFTELDIHEKELDDLGTEINSFTNLREFNASNNMSWIFYLYFSFH